MNQLGDLEKILSAAKEIGENFQKQLEQAREENELLKVEAEELREENKILREENEKIYLEMNKLRAAKDDIRTANEAFSNNLNSLATQLSENHTRIMAQISQLLNAGLQSFVVEYVKKLNPVEEEPDEPVQKETRAKKNSDEVTEVQTLDKYSDLNDEVIVEDVETAVATRDGSKKNKMKYAAFYAEEAEVEKDDAGNAIKMKNLVRP
jgi:FtsZ-binding cell division protein ZapB